LLKAHPKYRPPREVKYLLYQQAIRDIGARKSEIAPYLSMPMSIEAFPSLGGVLGADRFGPHPQ